MSKLLADVTNIPAPTSKLFRTQPIRGCCSCPICEPERLPDWVRRASRSLCACDAMPNRPMTGCDIVWSYGTEFMPMARMSVCGSPANKTPRPEYRNYTDIGLVQASPRACLKALTGVDYVRKAGQQAEWPIICGSESIDTSQPDRPRGVVKLRSRCDHVDSGIRNREPPHGLF